MTKKTSTMTIHIRISSLLKAKSAWSYCWKLIFMLSDDNITNIFQVFYAPRMEFARNLY